jgi:hypothetical protein
MHRTAVVDSQQIIELSGSVLPNPPTSGASLGNSSGSTPPPCHLEAVLKNLLIIVKSNTQVFARHSYNGSPWTVSLWKIGVFANYCITITCA